jgi:hypothetical protein
MAKPGRKESKIDWEFVKEHLRAQCTAEGIAGLIGVSKETLYNRCPKDLKMKFDELRQQMRESGKELLRKKQFDLALKGNNGMLVWLGKQYLNQSEKQEIDHNIEQKPPIEFIVEKST